MPIKRRAEKARAHPITLAALEAFVIGDRAALHGALNLKPWHVSPLDAVGECPWRAGTAGALGWPLAVSLRTEIMHAIDGD
jgi:hypothetical protein